jgi:hypothetical protein
MRKTRRRANRGRRTAEQQPGENCTCCRRSPANWACPRCGAQLFIVEHRVTLRSGATRQRRQVQCSANEDCGIVVKGDSIYGPRWAIRCRAKTKKGTRCTKWFSASDPGLVHCAKHGGLTPSSVISAVRRSIDAAAELLGTRGYTSDELATEARRIDPIAWANAEKVGYVSHDTGSSDRFTENDATSYAQDPVDDSELREMEAVLEFAATSHRQELVGEEDLREAEAVLELAASGLLPLRALDAFNAPLVASLASSMAIEKTREAAANPDLESGDDDHQLTDTVERAWAIATRALDRRPSWGY